MRFALFLANLLCHGQSRLKRSVSEFCAQLIDPLLGLIAFLGSWLLTNDLVVVDHCRAIIFLFIVKFRDRVRVSRLLVFENIEISARLSCFLAFRIMEKKILESSFSIGCGSGVFCSSLSCSEPDVADLILGIHGHGLIREFVHYSLVSL